MKINSSRTNNLLAASFVAILMLVACAQSAFAQTNTFPSSGNVGVGTTNPQRLVTIYKTSGPVLQLADSTSGSTADDGLLLIQSGLNSYLENSEAGNLTFRTNATDRVTINSSGNLGIGTSTPSYRLDVAGQINSASGLCIAGDCKTAWSQVGGGGSSQWTTSGSSIYYNSGNVSIGTTPLGEKLNVNGGLLITGPANAYTNGTNGLYLGMQSATSAQIIAIQANADFRDLGMQAKNFSVLTWDGAALRQGLYQSSAGSVGIGTLTPSQKVEAYNASGPTYFKATSGSVGTYLGTDGTNSYLQAVAANQKIFISNSAGTALLTADTGTGNVGIGTTTPAKKLSVVGDIDATGAITGGTINAKYQDVAEWVPASHALPAGTVVTLDPTKSNHVRSILTGVRHARCRRHFVATWNHAW